MLDIDSSKEIYIFILSINQGIILGLLYDVYRVMRKSFKPKKISNLLGDVFLWIIITFIVFMFLLNHLNGIFRGFVFIGFFIGGMFYLKVLSYFIFPILFKTFKLILYLISEIIKIITYPFKKISIFLKKRKTKNKKIFSVFIKETRKYLKIVNKKK